MADDNDAGGEEGAAPEIKEVVEQQGHNERLNTSTRTGAKHAERKKLLSMNVIERSDYEIKKARAHLTAGANRLHGGSKSYNCMRPQEVAALKHLGIRDIVSGNDHLIAIDCVGRLWTWGRGESGQLGRGEFQHSGVPKVVNSFQSQSADTKMKTKIKQVECGAAFSATLLDSGQLFTWGHNSHGQLGHGDRAQSAIPRPLEAMHRHHIHQVACGAAHMISLTTARDVFTWGNNDYGQLGHIESDAFCATPKQVRVMSGLDVKQIAAGDHHSCVLTSFGDIYTWGRGDFGQLGHGNQTTTDAPTLLQSLDQRTQASWLASGADFVLAITYSGDVYSWGRNHFGQLGHGIANDHMHAHKRLPDDVLAPRLVEFFHNGGDKIALGAVACGSFHVLALSEKRDTVYAWGRGEHGQLGLDPRDCKYKAVPQVVEKLRGLHVHKIACGINHSIVVVSPSATKREFQVLSWGRGSYGQLGHGSGRVKVQDTDLAELRALIRSPLFSSNQPPRSHAFNASRPRTSVMERSRVQSADLWGGEGGMQVEALAVSRSGSGLGRTGSGGGGRGVRHTLTRGCETVTLRGYVEAADVFRNPKGDKGGSVQRLSLSRKGSRGGGGAAGGDGMRAVSCEPTPINMYRRFKGGGVQQLSFLQELLDNSELRSAPRSLPSPGGRRGSETGVVVERDGAWSGSLRPGSPWDDIKRLGSMQSSVSTRMLVQRMMLDEHKKEYKSHEDDPPPLSMSELLALADGEVGDLTMPAMNKEDPFCS